ncbi:MAG: FAS1-like dehydratase domain-containing protein [Alphaproteobacteria bacterium]
MAQADGQVITRRDTMTAGPLNRLAAMLDRNGQDRADGGFRSGDLVPPLGHWLFFLNDDRQSDLARDGHAKRGDFPVPGDLYPRRMWAGSRIEFLGDLKVGQALVQRSEITSVVHKKGSSGPLVFVTLRHEIGTANGPPLIVDEHDIVYRSLAPVVAKAAPDKPETGQWRRVVVPDEVMLFRFSALTFNGHRIHYDRDYAMKEEGYPGLVVHGPLVATLLIDLLAREMASARLTHFSFRAVSPLFDGQPVKLNGSPPDSEGQVKLWATNEAGALAMTAQARIAAQAP